jgi:hypothetical protein
MKLIDALDVVAGAACCLEALPRRLSFDDERLHKLLGRRVPDSRALFSVVSPPDEIAGLVVSDSAVAVLVRHVDSSSKPADTSPRSRAPPPRPVDTARSLADDIRG